MSSTEGKIITCKAAIAWEPNKPLKFEQIEVNIPKDGEVRIKVLFTALCHTDLYTLSGKDPEGVFPVILGHEAVGIVESIGNGVVSVKQGDYVIPCFIPQCRACKFCKNPKTNLCQKIRLQQGQGVMPDGTIRFTCKGKKIFHFMGVSSFSEYTVCAEISVCKIPSTSPFNKISLLGCGVSTGYGAVLNTCKVELNSTVAVWGLGTVGLAVIMGAKEVGAKRILAIDLCENKFEFAKQFGATDCLNPLSIPKRQSLQSYLIENYDGGFDYTFECCGNVETMLQALESAHKGWGVSCIIGVAGVGEEIHTRPFQLITGRTWKGCSFGGWKSRDDVPLLVQKYIEGKIKLDEFITHRFTFDKINEAFDCMHSATECLRCVVSVSE
ncbi:hypothetical protein Mgra_00007331 [Meloidogyne graminicola]|uniref:S-(hydroxymethyl)glutathione dehydrogenase n=1 Tax=Meloidogyne graminicola TaxID=189291 RepID=A0A8S9ZIY4_9BILA|nr:hypothetical protein Mgra_00007331 [Meloidogyne graminicola]